MTGIYLGAASSLLWYLLAYRTRHSGHFSRGVWMVIALFIGIMAFDGINSLATDLALPTPYASNNQIRLVTGLLAGAALGALLSHIVTLALTQRPRGGRPSAQIFTLAPPLAFGAALCALAASGWPMLALPIVCLIVAASLVMLWAMTSVLVAIAVGRSWGFSSARQRDETLAVSFAAACVLLLALAGGRALLEQFLGPMRLS